VVVIDVVVKFVLVWIIVLVVVRVVTWPCSMSVEEARTRTRTVRRPSAAFLMFTMQQDSWALEEYSLGVG
jgi:hypothetical protein